MQTLWVYSYSPFLLLSLLGCNMFYLSTNLHMNILLKHMNIPITCLYTWWLDTLNLGYSYVLNLSLTSYEPNLDICSAIGLTTRLYWNFGYVMSKLRFLGLICYTHAIFNVYLESHACYEGLFTLLSYAMYVPNLYTRLCFCIE